MPTLSFLSPGLPGFTPPLAANPIAPAPTDAGPSDPFAAMLAGITALPPEASAAPIAATPGTRLPQVRQDPAVWMPEDVVGPIVAQKSVATPVLAATPNQPAPFEVGPDCEMPAAFDVPAIAATPKPPVPIIVPPDCEMPADVPPVASPVAKSETPKVSRPIVAQMPAVADEPGADVSTQPAPFLTVPKSWTLRLASALASTRAAPKAAAADPFAEPEPEALEKLHAADAVAQPVLVEAPPAQPQLLPANADMVTPTPVLPEGPAARSTQPVPAASSQDAKVPGFEAPTAPVVGNVPIAAANAPSLAPELMKQVARAIEQKEPQPVVATEPVTQSAAPVQAAPAPQFQPVSAPAPTAAPAFQPAPVDLGRADWVQAMVDRIAELPRPDGGREAQIRLLPDALGTVDVRIVERDDRMQVTLNADTAQARQLLAEAAPRLQEQAEARGLRFAQTEVGGGQSQDRRPADQQQPQTPQRPRSAFAGTDAEPQPQGDLIA